LLSRSRDGADLDRWLDPTITDPGVVLPLLQPALDHLLVAEKVSTLVNDVWNDSPQLIVLLDDQGSRNVVEPVPQYMLIAVDERARGRSDDQARQRGGAPTCG
jgi:hypothetical protein